MDSRSAARAALSLLKWPKQMADGGEQELAAGGTAGQSAEPAAASAESSVAEETEMNLPLTLVFLFGFSLALPVLSVVSSMPGGLISAAIIAFGMHQAWQMTGAPAMAISGPYRLAGDSAAV